MSRELIDEDKNKNALTEILFLLVLRVLTLTNFFP